MTVLGVVLVALGVALVAFALAYYLAERPSEKGYKGR